MKSGSKLLERDALNAGYFNPHRLSFRFDLRLGIAILAMALSFSTRVEAMIAQRMR